ncbi:meiosis-specific kinetochore protein [Marmota marmota marmota]|uniref:meiosis-specific kinetochore protein n=1 Tax=Marmota marmota marmota TaxID=9994 RepID=UPI002093EA54|nr:meiosis-specific kinetochore protein [Marmota marmota marmota]
MSRAPGLPRPRSGMALWSLRVYTYKKRAGQRLNVTPTPDQDLPLRTQARPGLGSRLVLSMEPGRSCGASPGGGGQGGRPGPPAQGSPRPLSGLPRSFPEMCCPLAGLKGKGKQPGLPKIAETEQSRQGASSSALPSTQLRITGETSLKENSTRDETQDEKMAPLSDSVTEDLQVDSSSSNSELISGLSLPCDVSSSLLSCSTTESYTEHKSIEEELDSFSSPELFRGSDYFDWEYPKMKEQKQCKNSTLLDTSKAVTIEKVPQFSDFSAILNTSLENYQKCHRKKVMTLAYQCISPKPKFTSNSKSDNTACEVLLAEKTCPSTPEKTKKKKTNSSTPDKKSRALLTSTPSSETADFMINLSSVQKAPFEELFPNISNYVNSDEIVPVSNLPENSSNEIPSDTSEICCIIRASPGTRQMKNKGDTVNKKHSPPKDITQVGLCQSLIQVKFD